MGSKAGAAVKRLPRAVTLAEIHHAAFDAEFRELLEKLIPKLIPIDH